MTTKPPTKEDFIQHIRNNPGDGHYAWLYDSDEGIILTEVCADPDDLSIWWSSESATLAGDWIDMQTMILPGLAQMLKDGLIFTEEELMNA